jgi:hypothetical protein
MIGTGVFLWPDKLLLSGETINLERFTLATEPLIEEISVKRRCSKRVLREGPIVVGLYNWTEGRMVHTVVSVPGYLICSAGNVWFIHNKYDAPYVKLVPRARAHWVCTDPYTKQVIFSMQRPPGSLTAFVRELDAFLTPKKLRQIEAKRKKLSKTLSGDYAAPEYV